MRRLKRQNMMLFVIFLLLISSTGYASVNVRREPQYLPASSIHHESTSYATASEMSPYPRHLDLDTLKNMPLVILHPRTPIKFKVMGENMPDIYKTLTPERIIKLLQSASSSSSKDRPRPSGRGTPRQAKNLNFGSSQTRSAFSLPFGGHQSLIARMPSASDMFSRPSHPGNRWPQRFRNSFSNMFSFAKPFSGMAATNRPTFMPFHSNGFHPAGSYSPLHQPFAAPNMWNQFQPSHSLHQGDFSMASSLGHPTKLQLGSYFNPYSHNPLAQHHFGGDLATSGSSLIPHRVVPAVSPGFAHYVSSVPKHKPLFNNIGGLKGASLEIRNAFADFTDSNEHGPEVSQRFGSVGHTINKFLDMMGLGMSGGLSMDDEGGLGRGANWASMDSTPISRSLDFYPGYGNQANLDDMEDFPIFLENITEQFLIKMNLTHLLDKGSEGSIKDSKTNSTDDKSKKKPESVKEKPASSEQMSKPDKMTYGAKITPGQPVKVSQMSNSPYAPAQTFDEMRPKNKEKGSGDKHHANSKYHISFDDDTKKPPTVTSTKGSSSTDDKKEIAAGHQTKATPMVPVVNYKIPSILPTVAPEDRKLPVAIYQNFPTRPQGHKTPDPPSYSPAQSLPQYEMEANPNKLVDDDSLRPWVPVSSGHGYVEKRPKSPVDITQIADQPKSLKIVQQVLSGTSRV